MGDRILQLPLQYLKDITDNFSSDREIGRGGFGVVYKGIELQSGDVIAVKRLKQILGGQDKHFKNEVNHLVRLSHDNIVKLIGYCDETKVKPVYDEDQKKYILAEMQEKLLCYEYMSNGSIENIIFDQSRRLDWQGRYKIVVGICQGLHYLHEGLDNTPIIHMDLKPSNILLDDRMEPKIADFGLSRLFSEEQTRTCTTKVMGTIGYMAPEYLHTGEISIKSDIYSLGIIILEVVTGKKNHQTAGHKSGKHFIENVRKHWTDMSQIALKHPSLGKDCLQQVHRCINIGLSCVEAEERRPSAGQILSYILSGECTYKVDLFVIQHNMERKLQLPLQYLKDITDNFSVDREIGRGGFGVVYKGIELHSGVLIAVKRLKQILGGQDKQFKNEVNHLARLSHENIVKLTGYCDETKVKPVYDEDQQKYILAEMQEKLLCYEYMSNGSLDNMIFDQSLGLDWKGRYKIVVGICHGLYYLHEGLDHTPIIHMDLKPSNILLGDRMEPKIADFGLSRLFCEEQTRTCTRNVIGSIGYMAPEYLHSGEISTKADIYSLGILILEIVTGKKNHQSTRNTSGETFIENVRKNWTEMSQVASKHPSLQIDYLKQVHRCIEIGLCCVEADQERRPSAGQLLRMLSRECVYKVYQAPQISTSSEKRTESSSNSLMELDRILNRTSTSRTSSIFSMLTLSGAKGRRIGILAFEVTNAIVKGSSLLKILSQENMEHLRENMLRSKGICSLISKDNSDLFVLFEADIREQLSRFATEVARFGNQCYNPEWHLLDLYLSRLLSEVTPQKTSNEALFSNLQYLLKLAEFTTELHRECLVLDKCYQDYLQCQQNQDETGRSNRELNLKHSSVIHQRNIVKNLRRKSLWSKMMEDILKRLVNIVHFLNLEINNAFLINHGVQSIRPASNLHQMLGPTGLALHYANVIMQINAMALTTPGAIRFNYEAKDALYQALPQHIRYELRERWPKEKNMVPHLRAEMNGILQWLVPIAESTRSYFKNGAFGEWAMKGMEDWDVNEASWSRPEERRTIVSSMLTPDNAKVNKIETLYYADKEKTEGYILYLVRALHCLVWSCTPMSTHEAACAAPPSPPSSGSGSYHRELL